MADVAAIRAGIAQVIGAQGLRVYPFYPDQPHPTCAYVHGPDITFDRAMARGVDGYTFRVVLLASRTVPEAGQSEIDGYLNTGTVGSMKHLLEADRTLDGTVDDSRLVAVENYGIVQWNPEVAYISAEFVVEVMA